MADNSTYCIDFDDDITPFPLDYDSLAKGDIIPVSQIEHITQEKYGTTAYALAALRIQQEIERQLANRDDPLYVVVRAVGGAIEICTDDVASRCAYERVNRACSSIRRNTQRLAKVDHSNLSIENLREHHRRTNIAAMIASGLREARRKAFASSLKQIEEKKPDN